MTKYNFGFVFFVFINVFGIYLATPLPSTVPEALSVEEQEMTDEIVSIEDKDLESGNPIYEIQLAVWPEVEIAQPVPDNSQAPVYEEQEIVYPNLISEHEVHVTTEANIPIVEHQQTTKKPSSQVVPIWQQILTDEKPTIQVGVQHVRPTVVPTQIPVAIFPAVDIDEAEGIASQGYDVMDDADVDEGVQHFVSSHKPTKTPKRQVEVIEQYHITRPNGTTEYKLVLSNGMTNYKKIYNKLLSNGKIVTVQEGYDSIPLPSDDPFSNDYQTQFYIADEHGNNIYRVEKHTRRPKLPNFLDYKLEQT